jgi:hypothetical protein
MRAPRRGAAQQLPDRIVLALERFLHIEAVRGGVIIFAALRALVWAGAPVAIPTRLRRGDHP